MRDQDCVGFLQWCLPRLGLRWPGYRKVRGTVCKRIGRRRRELGFGDLEAYRAFLIETPEEWARLDAYCRIPISRFYRDRAVFDYLGRSALPELAQSAAARGDCELRCWSAGCASGEEVYTLRMLWDLRVKPIYPTVRLRLLGTDADATLLRRAAAARYQGGSLKGLPAAWRDAAFTRDGEAFILRPEFRRDVAFQEADIRYGQPDGLFDLIVCRNLVFTYFAPGLQKALQRAIAARVAPGGYLAIGAHERLPAETGDLVPLAPKLPIYRKAPAPA